MIRRSIFKALSLAFLTTLSLPNTGEALIASVKSTGMAATATSFPLDSLAAAYNPANITQVCDRVDLGAIWDHTRARGFIEGNIVPGVDGSFNAAKTKDFYAGEFGIKKDLNCRVAVGVVVYNRNFIKTTYTTNFPLLGTSNMALEYLHETVGTTCAVRVNKCNSIGVSLNYNLQRVKVNGLEQLAGPISSDPSYVTNKGYSWSSGVGFTVGWYGRYFDKLNLGLAYQPNTHMGKFSRYKGFLAQRGKFNLPQRWNAGISLEVMPCATLAYDFEFVNWNQVKALSNDVFPNIQTLGQLGTSNGAGFGFKNQYFHRFGFNYQATPCFAVRVGFRTTNLPYKRDAAAANLLLCDTLRDAVTVGATYERGANEASFFYAKGFKNKVNGKNSISEGVPYPGFGGGEASQQQSKNALAIALARKF